jgi:hypothetical protein
MLGRAMGGGLNGRNLPRDRILSLFMELLSGGEANVKLKEPVGREFSRGLKKILGLESTKGKLLRNDLCSLSLN